MVNIVEDGCYVLFKKEVIVYVLIIVLLGLFASHITWDAGNMFSEYYGNGEIIMFFTVIMVGCIMLCLIPKIIIDMVTRLG